MAHEWPAKNGKWHVHSQPILFNVFSQLQIEVSFHHVCHSPHQSLYTSARICQIFSQSSHLYSSVLSWERRCLFKLRGFRNSFSQNWQFSLKYFFKMIFQKCISFKDLVSALTIYRSSMHSFSMSFKFGSCHSLFHGILDCFDETQNGCWKLSCF